MQFTLKPTCTSYAMFVFSLTLLFLAVCKSLQQEPWPPTTEPPEPPDNKLEIQTQLYIISGALGAGTLLLILLVWPLTLSVARVKKQIQTFESISSEIAQGNMASVTKEQEGE